MTDRFPPQGVAWFALAAVAAWGAWAFVPGSVVTPPPMWVEVFLPVPIFGTLLVLVVLDLRRGTVRTWLGSIAALVLGAALALQTMAALVIATFPSDF